MTAPAVIVIAVIGVDLLLSAYLHGRPRDAYNFWSSASSDLVLVLLLIWGGFFR